MQRNLIIFLLMISFGTLALAQTITVQGTVTNVMDSRPLAGVSVLEKGTSNGSVTDTNGHFTINVAQGSTLVISYVGMNREEIVVHESGTINIVMFPTMETLDEFVVIGYGRQRKSDLTGAVASISSENLTAIPVARLEQVLQGRAAGVFAQSNTGAPGANVNIRIRGITSINATNPMWIVDGVPADPRTVNPSDIESIEILKDASTAAIYGANGANGVVLVTTKKGQAGKTQVTYNASIGQQSPARLLNLASGPEFAMMYNEYQAILRRPYNRYYFQDYLEWVENPDGGADLPRFRYDDVPSFDYQKAIFQTAPMINHDLGVSGGSNNSTFYFGIGYTNQEGIVKNSAYNSINARVNSDHKPNSWLRVGQNFSISQRNYSGWEEWQLLNEYHTPVMAAINYHPFVPFTDSIGPYVTRLKPDGSDNWTFTPLGNTGNPVASNDLLVRESTNSSIKATAYAIIEPYEWISFETRATGDLNYGKNYGFDQIYFITSSNKNDNTKISRGSSDYQGWQWQNILNFQRTLFNDHNLALMAGFEAGYGKGQWMNATRWDLINATPNMWYFNASTNDTLLAQLPSGSANESSGYSYFGRASYDYRRIFLGQFNIRKDYSSRFGPRNRSGVFPSFSAGISFTEINTIQDMLPWLSFGKIRYGWGKVGNNAISDYAYFSTIALANVYQYSFDNTPAASVGAARNVLSNPAIMWESVVTGNLGLDLGFLNNRLSLTLDYFERYNEGMLMRVNSPGYAGFIVRDPFHEGGESNPFANIGELSNKGFEITAGWKESRSKFRYSIDLNYTNVRTRAIEISPDTIYAGSAKGMSGLLAWTVQSNAIGEYYGYVTEGIFRPSDADTINGVVTVTNQPFWIDENGVTHYAQPNAKPGDFRFKDVNGDGIIDSRDIVPIGNPNPPSVFGLNLNMSYGIFDMSMFFQGVYGNKIFNATKFYLFNIDGGFNWDSDFVKNHYRENIYDRLGNLLFEANHDGKYPRLDPLNANENFTKISDFYIEDGSYLRLRNLQVGVTLPTSISSRLGIERFRVYASGTNIFTFTRYSGFDPDIGSTSILVQGLDKAAYPNARIWTIGLNASF
jgi:TonB-dependent starch-binding outer membrane protein SusC